jgi:hypothetical protein
LPIVALTAAGKMQPQWLTMGCALGESGHTVIRMNTKDGRKDVLPTEERAWVSSPGHDVAACLISFDAQAFKFKFIKQEYFITSGIVDRLHIGPGDDVFVVGRFINHEGKQRNIPTARYWKYCSLFRSIKELSKRAFWLRRDRSGDIAERLYSCRSCPMQEAMGARSQAKVVGHGY